MSAEKVSHTPGPWYMVSHPDPSCAAISISENKHDFAGGIATVYMNTAANAALIVQAPALTAELAKLREAHGRVVDALGLAYSAMADIHHQWPGRHTADGQALLCRMLDALCHANGTEHEATQDEATMSGWLSKAKGRPG